MNPRTVCAVGLLITVALGFSAVGAEEPEVKKTGKRRVWYTSGDLRAELSYFWADRHLGDEWLVLKLSLAAGRGGGVVQIAREDVTIQTPDGHRVSMPSQAEFRRIHGSLRSALRQDNAWDPPSSRFVGSLLPLEEWFFSPPGATFHRNIIGPSAFRYASGPLVFQIPGGVQPGGWVVRIELEESTEKIPFVLGEHEK